MNTHFGILSLLIAYSAFANDVKGSGAQPSWGTSENAETEEHQDISPPLEPKSDKKFFGKDYPWDKRPKVDVFHFKHPYPVVQDSGDFDRDYVKDENSDDGSWKAQTEYDRLRHKLAKEKADVAAAEREKNQAEKELKEAMKRKEKAINIPKPPKPEPVVESNDAETESKVAKKVPHPGGIASPGDVKVATEDTKKAMDELEECKKELAAAREKLKRLVETLEEAKQRQVKTEEELDRAQEHLEDMKKNSKKNDLRVKSEYKEYMDAREEYLKQQALVAKMESDIEIAAEKVKEIRDSEDKDGGVYPGSNKKPCYGRVPCESGAKPVVLSSLLVVLAAAACFAQ